MTQETQISPCAICDNKASQLFTASCDYRKPKNPVPYDVHWCFSCNYGQVWNRPTKEDVTGFYDLDEYYTHSANKNDSESSNNEKLLFDRLRTHLAWRLDTGNEITPNEATSLLDGDSLTMLEIGCGSGVALSRFNAGGFSVVGVEPDPKARDAARSSGLSVYEGTAEELPEVVSNQKFDVVVMSHVLEHCLDINAAVSNARSVLKKGGVFIVETPNCDSQGFKDQRAEWPWSDIPRHLNFFTPASLSSILSKHGLDVVTKNYSGFFRQFTNSWLATEEEVWGSLQSRAEEKSDKPNFKLRAWGLLFKSLFSPKSAKYDSVRIIAKNTQPELDQFITL